MSRCDSHYLTSADELLRCERDALTRHGPHNEAPHGARDSDDNAWQWYDADEAVDEYGRPIRGVSDDALDYDALAQMFPSTGTNVSLTLKSAPHKQRTLQFAGVLIIDGRVDALRFAGVYEGEASWLLLPWHEVATLRWQQS